MMRAGGWAATIVVANPREFSLLCLFKSSMIPTYMGPQVMDLGEIRLELNL